MDFGIRNTQRGNQNPRLSLIPLINGMKGLSINHMSAARMLFVCVAIVSDYRLRPCLHGVGDPDLVG